MNYKLPRVSLSSQLHVSVCECVNYVFTLSFIYKKKLAIFEFRKQHTYRQHLLSSLPNKEVINITHYKGNTNKYSI